MSTMMNKAKTSKGNNTAMRSLVFLGTNVVIGVTLLANVVAGMFGNIRNVVRGVSSSFGSNSKNANGSTGDDCDSGLSGDDDKMMRYCDNRCFRYMGMPMVQVAISMTILSCFPFLVWMGIPFEDASVFAQAKIGWDALLHISVTPIFFLALFRGMSISFHRQRSALEDMGIMITSMDAGGASSTADSSNRKRSMSDMNVATSTSPQKMSVKQQQRHRALPARAVSPLRNLIYIGGTFFFAAVITSQLQVIAPSWVWNPFLLGYMNVFWPQDLAKHLEGLCVDDVNHHEHAPLCLNRQAWKVLSAEVLDSDNPRDVATVMEGVRNVRDANYGGLILNVMARDTVDAIPALRLNVEGLVPFFQRDKLALVVFENDSKDGTREAFKQWSADVASKNLGYRVDLVDCEEVTDCRYGMSHRYDSTEAKDYFMSSAIGKMADFRQRIVDHVLDDPFYENFGHMLVMDMDLQVSMSPLGVLHTLGLKVSRDFVVASSGRQTWPGGLGTLIPPYDFSAFRMVKTPSNANMLWLHAKFCGLMPLGDRWRNQCDAVSPMVLMLVHGRDRLYQEEPYKVASAFNGATLYPMRLIRDNPETGRYDAGNDGQRCEHIGFNLGLKDYMYVNPKWNFNISPEHPGGPTGIRAARNVVRIVFTPRLSAVIGPQMAACMVIFVSCVLILGMHVAYPVCLCLLAAIGGRQLRQQQVLWRYYSTRSPHVASKRGHYRNSSGPAPPEYWMMSSLLTDLTRRSSSAVMPTTYGGDGSGESDSMVESVTTVSMPTSQPAGGISSLEAGSFSDDSASSSRSYDHYTQSSSSSCPKAV